MIFKSIKDILISKIEESYIFEMTFERKTILNKIRGLQSPINEHLIKLIRYKDSLNYNKHIEDLETWLYDIQELDYNKKNKKLKSSDYYNVLFTEPITSIDNIQYITSKEKGKLKSYSGLDKLKTEKKH